MSLWTIYLQPKNGSSNGVWVDGDYGNYVVSKERAEAMAASKRISHPDVDYQIREYHEDRK